MILYHFTSKERLPWLMALGISRGDVPCDPRKGCQAAWLTTNPDPGPQKWKEGSHLNKTAVRLTVEVPANRLVKWSDMRGNPVPAWWYEVLNLSGGDEADNWYLTPYVAPDEIKAIESMEGDHGDRQKYPG